jgi:hypothetical protein
MPVHELIKRFPDAVTLRDRSRALAMLDAIVSPEWEDRYYSFDPRWSPGEEAASMRDGSGNDYAIVFSPAGVYVQACDHESPVVARRTTPPAPWPGLFDSVPEVFRKHLREPAFADHDGLPRASVCLWREASDVAWRCGDVQVSEQDRDDADGAGWLLGILCDGTGQAYRSYAEEVHALEIGLGAVAHLYALRPLTQAVVSAINPQVRLADLATDIEQIGYPTTADRAPTTAE